MSTRHASLDPTMRRIFVALGVSGAILVAFGAGVFGVRSAASVLLGVLVAGANLFAFVFLARLLARSQPSRAWSFLFLLKMAALFGGLFLLFRAGVASPLAFVAGYGALPLGITIGLALAPREDIG